MSKHNSDVATQVVLGFCEACNTPRSLAVWLLWRHNEHLQLLELSSHPSIIDGGNGFGPSVDTFSRNYAISSFLKKYKGLSTGIDLVSTAIGTWRSAEVTCRNSNLRIRSTAFEPAVERVIFNARRKISAVLAGFTVAKTMEHCRWGPGATFSLKRSRASVRNKQSEIASCTPAALPYFRALVESDPHWGSAICGCEVVGPFRLLPSAVSLVRGNRLVTVPKTAKTDRVIAAEPTANSFLQQGFGRWLRGRLRRFGVDLDSQAGNQEAARRAYSEGLSTLDLSCASDTISTELIYTLLPLQVALYLDRIRSPETKVDGAWVRLEKFASMGNAFCFELESLIFWALSAAASEQCNCTEVHVFGDDIIVERQAYELTVASLEAVGFKINDDKSFKEGCFFESCGKHYYRGVDVTPPYQKEVFSTPPEAIRSHNRLVRYQDRRTLEGLPALKLSACWRLLRSSYPFRPFPRVPHGALEDGGFLVDEALPFCPNRGFRCVVLDFVTSVARRDGYGFLAYKLRNPEASSPDPKGQDADTMGGKWRTRVRWLPFASVRSSEI